MRQKQVRITSIVPLDNILPPEAILAERWVYKTLVPILLDKYGILEWLARHQLIANAVICDVCDSPASLVKVSGRADGYRWSCSGHKFTRSVRSHSFFEGSHLSLCDLVMIIYMWSRNCPQVEIMHEIGMNPSNWKTISEWCKSLRELCDEYIERNPQQLGGFRRSGTPIIVEIEESKFVPRKYHRGRWRQGEWVLGAVERHSGRCFLIPVPDKTRESVYPIIRRWILPGTRIVSDGWAAYIGLEYIDGGAYIHETVVNQQNSLQPGPSTSDSGFVHQRNSLQPGPSGESIHQQNSLQPPVPTSESMLIHQRTPMQPGPSNDGMLHQRNYMQPGPSTDSMLLHQPGPSSHSHSDSMLHQHQRNSFQLGQSSDSMLLHQWNSLQPAMSSDNMMVHEQKSLHQGSSGDGVFVHQWNPLQPGPSSDSALANLHKKHKPLQQGPSSDGMQAAGRLLMDIGDTSVHQWNSLQSAQSNESALPHQPQPQRKSLQPGPSGDSGQVPKKRKSMQSGKSDDSKKSQNNENTWMRTKRKLRLQKKSQDKFPSYINEFIWRNRMKENFFESMILSIGNVYVFQTCGSGGKEKIPSTQESQKAAPSLPVPPATSLPATSLPATSLPATSLPVPPAELLTAGDGVV